MIKTEKQTIWYCHPTAGSPKEGMSYRPYYLAKYWKQAGHQAYVISSSFHHLLHQPKPQKASVTTLMQDGVDYIRLKTPRYNGNGLTRIINMMVYSLRFLIHQKKLLQLTGKPSTIIVSSTHPFHYFPLYWLAKKLDVPLVFEVRDLWPSSLIELLKLKSWHPLVFILGKIEKHAYRHADKVVSLLQLAKPYMKSQGLNPKKFHFIPNGTEMVNAYESHEDLPNEHQFLVKKLKNQKKFILAYTGAMGPPNALEYVVQAMQLLKDSHPHIHCILLGEGANKTTLQMYCKKHDIDNIDFLPRISKTLIPAFLQEADCLYLGWQDAKLYQYGVSPNKIFDYMLAAKPIIESGGAPQSIVTQAQCGFQCLAANPKDIAKTIINISEFTHEQRQSLGEHGKNYVMTHHHYPILAKDFLQILDDLSH